MHTPTNTLAPVNQEKRISALNIMATRLGADNEKLLGTLKATVFKNASNEELLALVVVANQYGLNPLTKEIYAFPAKGGGIVPVVSVDGWTNLMNSHPQFDGIEFEWERNSSGDPISCTSVIHRKDRSHATKVTEYFAECSRNTEPWKMKHRMLRHKSLIQGARVAFGFSGIYDEDEAQVISGRVEAVASQPARPIFSAIALPEASEPVAVVEAVETAVKVATLEEAQDQPWGDDPADKLPMVEAEFVPDTPQKQLMALLAERKISEPKFMAHMKKEYGVKARLAVELSDKEAAEAMAEAQTFLL